jgi:uncharacterized protein YyaL (SSP411 family)
MPEHIYTNALIREASPYLLQHAHNPVQWHPWSAEALQKSREQDKPILLSLGYSACHWCHVMAHESFEDAETAALMNKLFVNIKVDREERPDLDKIYQIAHQMLSQRGGGWPLTMFLAPDDLTPFVGGTYFPNAPRHGLIAFKDLLVRVSDYYQNERDEIDGRPRTARQRSIENRSPNHAGTSLGISTRNSAASDARPSFRTRLRLNACCAIGVRRRSAPRQILTRSTWQRGRSVRWPKAASTISSPAASAATRSMHGG